MDERAEQRVATDTTVECTVGEERFPAWLWNLSRGGCMVQFMCNGQVRGCQAEFEFEMGITVLGRIVWQKGRYAGVHFLQQLPEAAVRHLDVEKLVHKTWFDLLNLPHPLQDTPLR